MKEILKSGWRHIMKTIILVLLLVLVACAQTVEHAEKPIKIGMILPFTGRAAELAAYAREGAELANEELTSQGIKTDLLYQDDKCDPKEGLGAYEFLKTKDVRVFVGGICSGVTLALAPVAERDQNIIFTPGAVAESISQAGDFTFRDHSKASAEYQKLAEYASSKYAKITVLYDEGNDAYVQAAALFKKYFPKETVLIPTAGGSPDYRTEVLKAKEDVPDAVLLIVRLPDAVLMRKEMQEVGLQVPVLVHNVMGSPEYVSAVGALSEGATYSVADYGSEANPAFWQAYKKHWNRDPSIFAAQAYDVVKLLASAQISCKENTSCVRDYLYSIKDYPGAAGITTIDKNGDVLKNIVIMQIQNGTFVKVT